jgi:xylulokinase
VVSGAFSQEYGADPAFRTLTGGVAGTYLLETVLRGGTFTISWFLQKFGVIDGEGSGSELSPEEICEDAARQVPPGSLGLMLVPYWNGVMNPYWDPAASGIVAGWRGAHGKAHLYRAILEGIAFEQRLATSGVEAATGLPIERFIAMGGGSRSSLWCQIVADVTGKPVTRSASPEATCLGAAILAAAAAGLHSDVREAASAMVHLGETFSPNEKNQAIYDRLYDEVYRHLFPSLQSALGRLDDLTHGRSHQLREHV